METLHKAYLITELETTSKRIGIEFIRVGVDEWTIDGKSFKLFEILEYVYNKDAKGTKWNIAETVKIIIVAMVLKMVNL